MLYHKQTIKHDPEHGKYGDCFRTALACLLHVRPEDVPHFMEMYPDTEKLWPAVNAWLTDYFGYALFGVPYAGTLEEVLTLNASINPGIVYLLAGESPRGVTHQVICENDKIIHDPAPDGGGLIGPCVEDGYYWVNVLVVAVASEEKK